MAQNDTPGGPARQPFSFYAAQGRIYVRNRDQKIIDLGTLVRQDSGAWRYELDGNGDAAGGFFTEEAALQDVVNSIRFLWLDGQFTAVADSKEDPSLDLSGATRLDVELDELPPGEREFDATV
jgi:hypothetical protein